MTSQHNEASVSGQTLTSQGLSHAGPACQNTKKGAASRPPPMESGRHLNPRLAQRVHEMRSSNHPLET